MNEPKILPKDYEAKFDYPMLLDDEVMDEVHKIPDNALKAIKFDITKQTLYGKGEEDDDEQLESRKEAQQILREWDDKHGPEILASLKAWIPPTFEKYLKPSPFSFVSICEELKAIKEKFGVDDGDLVEAEFAGLQSSSTKLGNWEGEFARGAVNYVDALYTIVPNHGKVAQAMWYNMEAARAVYAETRESAKRIAKMTNSALEYRYSAHWPLDGPDGDKKLAVVVAAGTVGATAPPPLNVFSAMIAGGASILSTVNDDGDREPSAEVNGKNITLSGDTAWDILDNMTTAQMTLDSQITAQETVVRDAFQQGVTDRITDVIGTDFKAGTPRNSNLLPLKIDADPSKVYQEKE